MLHVDSINDAPFQLQAYFIKKKINTQNVTSQFQFPPISLFKLYNLISFPPFCSAPIGWVKVFN